MLRRLLLVVLLPLVAPALAGTLTLAWDPPSGPAPAGYVLYYGAAIGNYPSRIDVGNVTTYSVSGLVAGATYHFVATQYNSARVESGFSNDVGAVVPSGPPVASFTASTTSGTAPLALNFLNASTGNITSYAWTFGDGTSSTSANPAHVYSTVGVYSVSLTATGPGGSNKQTRTNYVNVHSALQPDTALYRKLVPGTGAALYSFLLDYNFDHKVDTKIAYGIAGDVPLTGNVAAGGKTSLIVYRNGTWYIDNNRNGTADQTVNLGGLAGDIPLTANFTGGVGLDGLVLYRSGLWYVDLGLNGSVDRTYRFGGMPGDVPLAGDVNGDGVDDLVIYRNGVWYIDTNRDGKADLTVNFGGTPKDIPLLFDYDGDGKEDLCIYRDGAWYVNTKRDGTVQAMFMFGAAGDRPFVGKLH